MVRVMISHILSLYTQVIIKFSLLLLGALLLALIIHTDFQVFEMSWSFSIWLEALAILP
jgi:hypothetical protein